MVSAMPSARRRPYTPRMPPDARREQLLDAAIAIIARDGYAGVSIDAIAREAGVTRPVVYGVFDGLKSLLYALLDRHEERALEQLLTALPRDLANGDPAALIVATTRRLAESVAGDPSTWRPILLAPEGTPQAVRERIARDRELVRMRIKSLLEAIVAQRAAVQIDTEIASHAVIGVAEYFGRLLVDEPSAIEVERLVAAVEGLLAALVIAP
jgi:AcrR family transcriptional regulator